MVLPVILSLTYFSLSMLSIAIIRYHHIPNRVQSNSLSRSLVIPRSTNFAHPSPSSGPVLESHNSRKKELSNGLPPGSGRLSTRTTSNPREITMLVMGSCFRKQTRNKAWRRGPAGRSGTVKSCLVDNIKNRVTLVSLSWIPSLRTSSPSNIDAQCAEHTAAASAYSSDSLMTAAAAAVDATRTGVASGR
ncbi:hypothetical protein OE88DRAFT_1650804 [Heliocybe sulcata]|uniref:Uncharacterized protein n=1 Tax=Heliocybe sulcata TaxID=5364 RepID=A0A5C3NIG7_9AGAM|nr:hypothetical protein OE88DRAFT_1650804 [Heliocybe sulcata]